MELLVENNEDILYRNSHPSGNYSVKTGYAFLINSSSLEQVADQDYKFFKLICSLNIPPKWSLFLWKLVMNGLAVRSNLIRRGVDIEGACVSCGMMDEDLQHLFRFCSFARYAWNNSSLHILTEINESTSLRHWIQHYILLFNSEDGKRSERLQAVVGVLWSLWLTKNGRVFRNERGYVADYFRHLSQTMNSLESFLKPDSRPKEHSRHLASNGDQPPGYCRVNIGRRGDLPTTPMQGDNAVILKVDGSWDKTTGHAGFGWAYSLDAVNFWDAGGEYGTMSALHAELTACLKAISWAKTKGYQCITICTDSFSIVQMLRSPNRREVRLLWTLQELLKVGGSFDMCTLWKVGRDQISQAHFIAGSCRRNLVSFSV
ncbi:uncharacterized protein LOC110691351 [Chenopodium quinoa]|uniref:uncharacterized protein LOC110691351 n=1 Tax=Chenopodium quinoa TaxID=63459 RepID=UPI000B79343C|nr:uncharacterized protein LOC110691351 [Chenopodium quinoa]